MPVPSPEKSGGGKNKLTLHLKIPNKARARILYYTVALDCCINQTDMNLLCEDKAEAFVWYTNIGL